MAFQIDHGCLWEFFPKNEGVQTLKISTLVAHGLNNPEACYQSLNVILFRQVSSSNCISQRSILIIFLSMRSKVSAKGSATLTHSRVQQWASQAVELWGLADIYVELRTLKRYVFVIKIGRKSLLLLHVWKCCGKNLLRLHSKHAHYVCWSPKCNNSPKCNKVLNVITFGPKCNKVLNVITFSPKCNKPLMQSFNSCSALLLWRTSTLIC